MFKDILAMLRHKKKPEMVEMFKPKPKLYCRKMSMKINICKLTSCNFYGKCVA